jgi:hypothetical protein
MVRYYRHMVCIKRRQKQDLDQAAKLLLKAQVGIVLHVTTPH